MEANTILLDMKAGSITCSYVLQIERSCLTMKGKPEFLINLQTRDSSNILHQYFWLKTKQQQYQIYNYYLGQMTQPVKYLSVVSRVIELYQFELMTMFKKMSLETQTLSPDILLFRTKLEKQIKKLKEIQDQKSIADDKISDVVQPMVEYINAGTTNRVKNTSQSERYAIRASLRTQDTHRMRLTGGLKRNIPQQSQPINESAQMDQIIRSYKIQQEIGPRMRMKWKSLKNGEEQEQNASTAARRLERTTIGDNNIDLLSYTIPQIENSIKRLSLQSVHSKHRSPDKIFQAYRTIDTRGNGRKKFVPRLI